MKKIFPYLYFVLPMTIGLLFTGCKPQEDDAIELSAPPSNVSFTIEEKPGAENTYILTNTTSGAFLYQWDLGNGTTASSEVVEVYYQFMGDYEVTLRAFNQGGFGEAKQTISVLEDGAPPCTAGSLIEFITDCDERTWILLQDGGAYWVGPDDATTWWTNSSADVTTRFCAFDDEWVFTASGEMTYDTKGDLWGETYMGFASDGCVTDQQLADVGLEAWGPGNHTFVVSEGANEQLQVIGLGAFLGFPKVANGAEVTQPQSQVTYDIIDRGEDVDGKFMELEVNFGPGLWRFKYVSPN